MSPAKREEKSMLAKYRTAEEWLAEHDRIIREYRSSEPKVAPARRQRAIRRFADLGLSPGEAVHYLDRHIAKPAVRAQTR